MKEDIKKYITNNYENMSTRQMGSILGVSGGTICRYAKRMGLKLTKNKFNVDKSLYENIDKKEFVYFLGFLWADGHLQYYKNGLSNSTRIETTEEDSFHICEIINKLPIKYSISKRKRDGRKPQQCIVISDCVFSQFLVSEFSFDKKSFISHENILQKIPEELHVYWFQGYMDGDGHIRAYLNGKNIAKGVIELSSSYDQEWEYLLNYLKKIGCDGRVIKYISKKGYKSSKIYISKIKNCNIFLDWLYQDTSCCLQRKLDKYLTHYKDKNSA